MDRKDFTFIAKTSFRKWQDSNATLRAAALAFFIILPLPTLLIIIAGIYAIVFGPTQGIEILIRQIQTIAGPTIALLVGQLLKGAENPFTSLFNSFFSIVFTLSGAVGVFVLLQNSLNAIWEIKLPKGRSNITKIKERFVPFLFVLIAGAIVVFVASFSSLVLSSIYAELEPLFGPLLASVGSILTLVLPSFVTSTFLFAIVFKELPDTEIEWQDVAVGAVISGFVFTILNSLYGWYLRTFPATSMSGATAALLLLLLWIFVTGEFLLYGTHFSKVYTENIGSHSKKKETESQFLEIEKLESEPVVIQEESPAAGVQAQQTRKMQIETQEAAKEEPNPLFSISESHSADGSEKEYRLNVKWKIKRQTKLPEEPETEQANQ